MLMMLVIRLAVAGQRRRKGFEIAQRVLYRDLIVGDHLVDVAQRHADFFLHVQRSFGIGGQFRNAVGARAAPAARRPCRR